MATHERRKLTDRFVRAVKPPAQGRDIYPDTELPGFMLRVYSSGTKSYALNRRWPGDGEATKGLMATPRSRRWQTHGRRHAPISRLSRRA